MTTNPTDTHDWEGRKIEIAEHTDKVIDVWEVAPAIGDRDHDSHVYRSWHDLLTIGERLDVWLDNFSEDELRDGVTLTVKLIRMRKGDYDDLRHVEEP